MAVKVTSAGGLQTKMADESLDLLALDELLDAALIEFEVGLVAERDLVCRSVQCWPSGIKIVQALLWTCIVVHVLQCGMPT